MSVSVQIKELVLAGQTMKEFKGKISYLFNNRATKNLIPESINKNRQRYISKLLINALPVHSLGNLSRLGSIQGPNSLLQLKQLD